jgi:DNA-binding NarL/FixJ family response regulator
MLGTASTPKRPDRPAGTRRGGRAGAAAPPAGALTPKPLTPAERTILRALREGGALDAIAAELGSSELTVRTHVRNARAKLEVPTTVELRRRLIAGELDERIAEPDP